MYQWRRPFFPPLPIVNNDKSVVKASSHLLKVFLEVFIAPLLTALRGKKKWRLWTCVLNWQFSEELPTPVQAGALGLNDSHPLGEGQIQLKVQAPLS